MPNEDKTFSGSLPSFGFEAVIAQCLQKRILVVDVGNYYIIHNASVNNYCLISIGNHTVSSSIWN